MISLLLYIAVLTWSPVTLNTDGSPCTDLAGYRVYRKVAAKPWRRLASTKKTQFKVANLGNGIMYRFYITAYDTHGIESDHSKIVRSKK